MRVSNLFAIKTFLCILLKTSAQCGFVTMCFISCLQFLTSHKAAFYRCRSDGELLGSIAYFAGQSSAPDGWLLCDGSTVSRTTYTTLFSVVGTTYGAGNGSTTFALPNLIDKFVEGSATAGTAKAAGLPNIIGTITTATTGVSGAFIRNQTTNYREWNVVSSGPIFGIVTFNASNSNSIYGKSTTVQPPALTMLPFIYTGKTSLYKWQRTA